jgi:hypothetical protein
MQLLQIDEKKAKGLFKTASSEFKAMLVDTFGEKFFIEKITDRIKTFEDACAATGEHPNDTKFSTGTPDEIAYKKLKVIIKALNEDWIADYSNTSQKKWYPWFQYTPSGFRFDVAGYDYAYSGTFGGSLLSFSSEELARYAATQFTELYNQFLN